MTTRSGLWVGCLVVCAAPSRADEPPVEFAVGGCGGAYFYAEPGELEVWIEKRDRNQTGRPTELRAILFSPDRRPVDEVAIPFAGGARGSGLGPAQRAVLRARVERTGVWGLNVTVSNDRYGDDIVWGLWTGCPRWLVETARGHRDARHEEPIVLLDPDRPGDVCFMPRAGAFEIRLAGLLPDGGAVTLHDAEGRPVGNLTPDADGQAQLAVPAGARGAGPWRLHFPRAKAVVHIDGVTRWEAADTLRDQCVWSPRPETWFPWSENRWLLFPYRRLAYGPAGAVVEVPFRVHNNALFERSVRLDLAFPGDPWPAQLSAETVTVPARQSVEVTVRGAVPAQGESSVQLCAAPTEGEYTTYATLTLRAGDAPAYRDLDLPVVLRPYEHENEQFGYLPDYPVDNQPYFAPNGVAMVRTGAGIAVRGEQGWTVRDFAAAVVERIPSFDGPITGVPLHKIAFDADGDVYAVASSGRKLLLLHSADGARTFRAYVVPVREDRPHDVDIEQFSGHNLPADPPALVVHTLVPTEPDPKLFWRRVNELVLFCPRKVNGRIELGEPIPLSAQSLGLSHHSGAPSTIVSRGERVHVAWGEATDPAVNVPGVPALVVTYDRSAGRLGRPALIGYGPPPNDVHNTPNLTIDGDGYLHALTGTHGRPFGYARSLAPNDAGGGWTPAETTGENLSQTYIGLVCGPDGTLHLVYRLSRGGEPFPLASHNVLAYQRKRPGQPWDPPRPLVVPAFSEYCIYYHRLTIDHAGRLYISYDYWSTHWFYRNDQLFRRRAVLVSDDGGEHWRYW